jgi:reverse transcriptase-like protein
VRSDAPVHLRSEVTARGVTRVFADLSPSLAARYEREVRRLSQALEGRLHPGVAAGRTVRGRPIGFAAEYRRWSGRLHATVQPDAVVVRSDVRECFASISLPAVERALRGLGLRHDGAGEVLHLCASCGVRGLPVGPWPSAVLANAVLAESDRAAARTGVRVLRWVDDVLFVSDEPASAWGAFEVWREALAEIGLEPHEGKTALATGEELRTGRGAAGSFSRTSARGMLRPP